MKNLCMTLLASTLLSAPAFANSHDDQVDLDLQAMALVQFTQNQDQAVPRLANPLDFFGNLQGQIQSLKETLLLSYDTNGNGKIDIGPEFDAFKESMQVLVLALADSNQNGKIDLVDIGVLTQTAVAQLQTQVKSQICPGVIQQVEEGFFLFKPFLTPLYQYCTAE